MADTATSENRDTSTENDDPEWGNLTSAERVRRLHGAPTRIRKSPPWMDPVLSLLGFTTEREDGRSDLGPAGEDPGRSDGPTE